jgi:uncharacterized cupredoxin-like copper-binding protein
MNPEPPPVTLTEFTITPATLSVRAGETVRFTLDNVGQFPHDLHIEGQGIAVEAVPGDGNIPPGESVSWEITFQRAGSYQVWCPVGQHRSRGMEGTLAVAGISAPQVPAVQLPR